MAFDRLLFRIHAIERMLEHGEVIEEIRDEYGQMKRLYLHHADSRPIHVVVIDDEQVNCTIVITAYEPDLIRWEQGFRRPKR